MNEPSLDLAGFFAPWAIYAVVLLLHLVVPAHDVAGYVRDEHGTPLRYRLNGMPVMLVVVLGWALACSHGLVAWDWLYLHRVAGAIGAASLGLAFAITLVVVAPSSGRAWLVDLYLGRIANPRVLGGRVDLKMLLYLVGATMLELNLLSFAAHHVLVHAEAVSPGVLLHVVLFTWFVADYLFFERVHLYTYDLFAEKVGFKLGWGCLAFYPYFYAVGLWTTAALPDPGMPAWALVGAAVIFFAGWCLARGANMQKFVFKLDPSHRFLGRIAPETIDGRLLCSGFWGVARHVNYLGEILMATGLALALGHPGALGPWLYPLYYVVLLVPRERDDHRRCAAKYGAAWDAYCARVPWRIIPRVY